jgi:ribosomal protein L40E
VIGVREVLAPDVAVDVGESSLLLPLPGLNGNSIVFEDRDGSKVRTFRASAFVYSENKLTVAKAAKLAIAVFVTDARVAFACARYDKGGGWTGAGGGAILALSLNAASMAKAAYQRRGKSLVGQVRYQSLAAVGSGHHPALLNPRQYLALAWEPTSTDRCHLQLTIEDGDVSALAADIARRAVRYALAVDPALTDEKRTRIQPLLDAKPLGHLADNKLYYHNVPSHFKENETTARYGLGLPKPPPAQGTSHLVAVCPKCGTQNRLNRAQCFECGTNIVRPVITDPEPAAVEPAPVPPPPDIPATALICRECGTKNRPDRKGCFECGGDLCV